MTTRRAQISPEEITAEVRASFTDCDDDRIRAAGHRTLTAHVFDRDGDHLGSDAVFAVKPSLLRTFVEHRAGDPDPPAGVTGDWVSVGNDIVLAPAPAPAP